MALNLSIIKSPTNVSLSSHQKTFSEPGGTIGRGESNDWVLGDPDRFLSSRHCGLSFENGQYFVTDMSTNGTFLNGSAEPLGKGGKAPLTSGDSIELGDYQFRVEIEGAATAALDPFESIEPTSTRADGPVEDPFATPFATSAPDPFASDPFSASEQVALNPDHLEVDPLAALDGVKSSGGPSLGAQSGGAARDPFGEAPADPFDPFSSDGGSAGGDIFGSDPMPKGRDDFLGGADTHSDGAGAINQSVDWPSAKNENMIPDDWDDDFLGDNASSASSDPLMGFAAKGAAPAEPARPSEPAAGFDDPLNLSGAHQSLPLTDPPKTKNRPQAAPPPLEEPLLSERRPEKTDAFESRPQRPKAQAPVNKPKPKPKAPSPQQLNASAACGDALLAGLGLSDTNLSEEELINLYASIGELIPVIITGMMQVLRSRASIKNEFRMNVTTIQPIENNPLKFSADAFEAIENMFVRKSSAYMGPKQAFQEGFDGIGEHQVAIIAGIRAAFKSMMDRFNPDLLERQFEKQTKGVMLPGMQKAKLWSSYSDHYQGFVDNMENTFQYLFGDEFVQAYEDQLRRLAAERKKRP